MSLCLPIKSDSGGRWKGEGDSQCDGEQWCRSQGVISHTFQPFSDYFMVLFMVVYLRQVQADWADGCSGQILSRPLHSGVR